MSNIVCRNSSNEEDGIFTCSNAVAYPGDCCVLQMLPHSILENLASVEVASNQAVRDEVHCWAISHQPWIVTEDAAPQLWISSRPKLNRLR